MDAASLPDLSPRMGIGPQSTLSEAQAYSIHLESIQQARERAQETHVNEKLNMRSATRTLREYVTEDGDLVIARRVEPGVWTVTAHSNDLGAQVQGLVQFNEGGFRGRQWESAIDGQQHPSLIEAMREAVSLARQRADFAAFHRTNPERRYGCTVCPFETNDPDAAQAHVDYLTTHPRGWLGEAEEHPVIDRQAGFTYTRDNDPA